MSRKTDNTEIDGIKLKTTQLQPRAAAKLAARLLKYLAPVLGQLKPTDEVDMNLLAGALRQIMFDMSDEELDAVVCKTLACTIAIRNNDKGEPEKFEMADPAQIDLAFAGKLGAMFKAVQWVLGVNYADFFDGTGQPTAEVKAS